MRKGFYLFTVIFLCVIICVQAVIIIVNGSSNEKKETVTQTVTKPAFILTNPIDMVFSKAFDSVQASESMRRDLRERYKKIWKDQFDALMDTMAKKCKTDKDIENLNQYRNYTYSAISNLQPFLLNCMLDNFEMEESPEKNSWGNSTQSALDFREGMIYRDAVLFIYNMNSSKEFDLPETDYVYGLLSDFF